VELHFHFRAKLRFFDAAHWELVGRNMAFDANFKLNETYEHGAALLVTLACSGSAYAEKLPTLPVLVRLAERIKAAEQKVMVGVRD
jgi:hypothetical protein